MNAISEFSTRFGAIFVQKNGANQPLQYVGCHGLEGLSEDLGTPTTGYCFDKYGNYVPVAESIGQPSDVSFSITTGLGKQASILDALRGCRFNIYATNAACGKPHVFANYDSVSLVQRARISTVDRGNLVARDSDERITRTFGMVASPPISDSWRLRPQLLGSSSVMDSDGTYYSLAPCNGTSCGTACQGTCGGVIASIDTGETDENGMIAYISPEGSIEVRPTRPFEGTDAYAGLVLCLDSGRIVALWTPAAVNQFSWAYSDDGGYNWVETISGVSPTSPSASWSAYAIGDTIWVGAAAGYIYLSEDGGATFTAVESGVITTNPYSGIHFRTETEGYAIASDAFVASFDGGLTWAELTAPEASGMRSIWATNDYIWITGNRLWYRAIEGTTWYSRTLPLSFPISAAPLTKIRFFNDYIGAVLQTGTVSAGQVNRIFYTVTGGAEDTWIPYDLGVGAGSAIEGDGFLIPASALRDIQWCGSNTLFGAGDDAKAIKLSAF